MGAKRKYILNVITKKNIGLNVDDVESTFSLLNSFTVLNDDGEELLFSEINVNQLGIISNNAYHNRVYWFLRKYVGLPDDRVVLYDESQFDDTLLSGTTPTYDEIIQIDDSLGSEGIVCGLNPMFTINTNNSGIITITNVGGVNGIIQYKVHPTSSNPSNYIWVTNNTFVIESSGSYNVSIRDNINGYVLCEYTRTISVNIVGGIDDELLG